MKYKVVFGMRGGVISNGDTIVSNYNEARKLAHNLVKVFSNNPSCTEFTDLKSRTVMCLDWSNENYFVTLWPLCGDMINDGTVSQTNNMESLLPAYKKQPERFLLVSDTGFSTCLVRLVLKGDAYNNGGLITTWWGNPIVEFYDPNYGNINPWLGTKGLFLMDYGLDELLKHEPQKELRIKVEGHEWCFSKQQMQEIIVCLLQQVERE